MVKYSPKILANEENTTTTIINVINVKLCMMVLHCEHYLFTKLSVTLTLFQGHSSVKQF